MIEEQFGIKILPIWHGEQSGDPAKFTQDVRLELSRILRSRAGRILADCLRFQFSSRAPRQATEHGKAVLLMPYEGNDCNAEEDGVTPGSQQSVVLFTPVTGASGCSSGKSATLPHEVLVHELVHALRRVSGHLHPHKVINRLQPYTHTEEFLAILVTNIFISDVTNHHKTSLRANHQGHAPLDPELADSFRFFSLGTRAFNLISAFCDENSGCGRMLATVQARFNPIAAYYKNRRKAFEMAANGDADFVFEGLTPMDYWKAPGGVWKRIIPYAGPPPRGAGR